MKLNRIGIMTSGGDAPGMNAALRAVVRTASHYDIDCMGISLGYQGLIEGKMIPLGPRDVKNIIHRGGTILKTARSKVFKTAKGRQKAYENFKKSGLEGLVVIGGDGSFTGAMIFGQEYDVPIIGIPGTIDNDIYGADFTIGYDTALNTAIKAIDKIRDTATSHDRLFFVEVMGRDAGFIALNSGIATGALDILIPEENYNLDQLFSSIEKGNKEGKSSSIIIVAEGEKLGGVYDLAQATRMKYPDYDIRVSILGHIQRGGNPSCSDRVLASRLGVAAVEALKEDKRDMMAGIQGNKIIFTPFKDAIQKHNEIDRELIRVSDIIAV
ncbi:MAG: 6-phosphofructokinase [Flavobacteriales bacterium AspAUS03]